MESKDFFYYEFGEFQLDARRRSLTKNGEKVPVSSRNFDLLLFMVENGGRVLEHDELLDKVWVGTFVEQSSLKKGVSALRHILEEKPETEYIKTIPRRGYSFVSPVRVVADNNEVYFVRETEREIIVEEFIETDDAEHDSHAPEKIIDVSPTSIKALPSAEQKKSNFLRLALFGIAGIAVLGLTIFGLKAYFSKTSQQQFNAENVRVTRITNNSKVIAGTAISPDGTTIVYPTIEKDGNVLWLRQVLANSATKLTPPMNGSFWAFAIAPDNSYVYYIFNNPAEPQKSGLFKIPFLGGEPQRLAENVSSLAISPDGKQLAVVRISDVTTVFSINPNGENERIISTLPDSFRLWSIAWTPDGTNLICSIRKIIEQKFLFYVAEISPETGKEKVILSPQDKNIFSAVWLPDKSAMLLVVREPNADIRQIWQYFPASQEWRRVTNDNNSYKQITLTRDGKMIVSSQESRLSAVWLSDETVAETIKSNVKPSSLNRNSFRQITDGISNFDRLSWLADGRLIY